MSVEAEPRVVKPFTEQRPFLKREKRYLGYISGVGAGKTFAGIIRTVRNMTEWNPGEMGAIVAPTRQMTVNVIIPEMRNLGLFDAPIDWEYKSAYSDEPGIHAPNGSRALILSADNTKTIERLRGLNLAWGWIDEEAVVDPRAREILMQRLRTGDYRNLYITTTPKGKNHTYDFFVGDYDPEQYEHGEATIYECDDRLAIVGVPTSANPHTPEDYKAAMDMDMPDQIHAQEIRGQFIDIGAGVYSVGMFDFIHPSECPEKGLQPVIAIDPAGTIDAHRAEANDSDYWAVCVGQAHRMSNTLYITDTARQRGMTLSQGCEWIGQIANSARGATIVAEINSTQEWLLGELRDRGVYPEGVTSTREKEARLLDLTIPISNGTIKFVDFNADTPEDVGKDHPYGDLVSEALAFPDGAHDDLLDSLHKCAEYAPVRMGGRILGADMWGEDDDDEGDPRYA